MPPQWFCLKYQKGFVVLFSPPCISVRNQCSWISGNQNKANGPAQTTLSYQWSYTWRCHGSRHIDPFLFYHQQLPGCLFSKSMGRMQTLGLCHCNHSFHSLSGFFFKSSSLRIELSFITLLTVAFFLISTFNTVKIVLKHYENKTVGIVMFLCVYHINNFGQVGTTLFFQTSSLPVAASMKCREMSSPVDRSARPVGC